MSSEAHVLQWTAPLAQFQVDSHSYHPLPPLYSPPATIFTDHFALQWQLSLEQQQHDAQIFLHYRTPGIPNQGVRYSVFLLQTNGTSTQLTDEIRRALAKYRPESRGGKLSLRQFGLSRGIHGVHLDQLVWNGETVKIRVIIAINRQSWSPSHILNKKICSYPNFESEPGLVGIMLWSQVRLLAVGDPIPANTDLIFECPTPNGGDRVAAHRAVVAAFSEPFQRIAHGAPTHRVLVLKTSGIGSTPLLEMLHFVYLRHLSPHFHHSPLNELLEAANVFQLPDIVKWEIEKVLCIILDEGNCARMQGLASKYGLQILQNKIDKCNRETARQRVRNGPEDDSTSSQVTLEEKAAVGDHDQ